jgi:hypothetical protein
VWWGLVPTFRQLVTKNSKITAESYMIELKSQIIDPGEIAAHLKKNLQIKELCNNILFQKIIYKSAQERGI